MPNNTAGAEERIVKKLADKICFKKAIHHWSLYWGSCSLLVDHSAPRMPELL